MDSKIRGVLAFLFWADDEYGETVSYGDVKKAFEFSKPNGNLSEYHPCTPQLRELVEATKLVDRYLADGERVYKLTAAGRQALMEDTELTKLASIDLRFYTFDFFRELCPGCRKVTPLLLYPKDKSSRTLPLIFCTCGFVKCQGGRVLREGTK
jgi:hypothetical protein